MNQVAASRYQETSPDIGEPILLDLFATIERKKKDRSLGDGEKVGKFSYLE